MMTFAHYIVFSLALSICVCQRPSYAGTRPIGYPALEEETTVIPSNDDLSNRLGPESTTSERLPPEAMGDRKLVERLRKLPLDKQPFWLLNWQSLEENRNQPQTYNYRQNSYLDPIPNNPTETTVQTMRPTNAPLRRPWWSRGRYFRFL